jgi:septation ring formation regulator EzrA
MDKELEKMEKELEKIKNELLKIKEAYNKCQREADKYKKYYVYLFDTITNKKDMAFYSEIYEGLDSIYKVNDYVNGNPSNDDYYHHYHSYHSYRNYPQFGKK